MSAPSSVPAPSETVYHALAVWATHATEGRLTAWAVGGGVDAVGVALFLPELWLLALPLACISSIGFWGLAFQRRQALAAAGSMSRLRGIALQAVMTAAVTVGTLAAIGTFYGLLLLILGRRWGPSGG